MVLDSGAMLTPLCTLILQEPQSLLAFAVLAFAAGMFPVGLMLGSECNRCCDACQQCVTGALPRTITVSFSGLEGCCYQNRSFVLSRIESDITQGVNYVPEMIGQDCVFGRPLCFLVGETGNRIFVAYNGPSSPPTAGIVSAKGECNATWTASENIEDCSQFGFEATNDDGQTITVTSGGDYAEWHELPETATVTLDNFPNITKAYKVSESGSFTVVGTCFGSGAGGVGLEPGGNPGEDEGPLSSIKLTNGGSGYAILGRVEPLVTAYIPEDYPGQYPNPPTLEIQWDTTTDNCGRTTWAVGSVSVTDPGGFIPQAWPVYFSSSNGDTVVSGAAGYCVADKDEPEVTATVPGGSDAVLEVVLKVVESVWDAGSYWGVDSVTIVDGGTGYLDGDDVVFTLAEDDTVTPITGSSPEATIETDNSGTITAINVTQAGEIYKSLGVASVVVTEPGEYYRESSAVAAIVSPTTITFTGAGGNGATLSATVDDDPGSATFGQVTSVSITNGGSGYLLYEWAKTCCGDYYDGMGITLARGDAECSMRHDFCGVGNLNGYQGSLEMIYYGPNVSPAVGLVSESSGSNMCNVVMTTDESICADDLSFTATNALNNQTADVAAGGQYDEFWRNPDAPSACHICCRGEEAPPDEIEVDVEDLRVATGAIEEFSTNPDDDFSGTYMFEHVGGLGYEFSLTRNGTGEFANSTASLNLSLNIVAVGDGTLQPSTPSPTQRSDHWVNAGLPQDEFPFDQPKEVDICEQYCHHKCLLEFSAIFQSGPVPRYANLYKYSMCADALDTPLCRPPEGTIESNTRVFTNGEIEEVNDEVVEVPDPASIRITISE